MSRPDDTEAKARAERLAAALRANLKRRKTQARGRQAESEATGADVEGVAPAEEMDNAGAQAVDKAGNSPG
ncbi:hypothetical protein MKI84_08020 [Ancylobacter sp. A5.8]|uniref:hypothetical protein n=1 Tax=Ancylobacter gelatini TaxID=2919920 RepID=UPI001F4F034C|nr:hypothetical protein [Ancylobacter gelatini]MCJ8142862.1 hypothetical protein [Ancylobacter gelatini]